MDSLEEAISLYRESLSLRPMSHPDRSISLSGLATALGDRFRKTGSMTDLEEAILMHRESLSLHPIQIILYHSLILDMHFGIVLDGRAQ